MPSPWRAERRAARGAGGASPRRGRTKQLVVPGRVVGFALVPVLGVITPLIALPAITSRFGAPAWAAIAVATAMGAIVASLVELGWAWNGPMRVARSAPRALRRHVAWAAASRALLLPLGVAAVVVLVPMTAPGDVGVSLAVAIGVVLAGMDLGWVYVGLGAPWRIIALEALPRVVCVSIAATLLHAGADLWVYPVVGLLAPSMLGPVVVATALGVRPRHFRGLSLSRVAGVARAQLRVALARCISTGYMQLPIILVAAVTSVQQTALFGAGDRLARMVLSGLSPLPSMFQHWVGRGSPRERPHRVGRAIVVNVALGVVAGISFALLGPVVSHHVFSGTATIDPWSSALLGAMIVLVSASRAVGGLGLVAQRKQAVLLRSTVVGVVLGVPLAALLAAAYGAIGAFAAVLVAEAAVLLVQARALRVAR